MLQKHIVFDEIQYSVALRAFDQFQNNFLVVYYLLQLMQLELVLVHSYLLRVAILFQPLYCHYLKYFFCRKPYTNTSFYSIGSVDDGVFISIESILLVTVDAGTEKAGRILEIGVPFGN